MSSHALEIHQNFATWGNANTTNVLQRTADIYTLYACLVCVHAPLTRRALLTQHKSNDKIIKDAKRVEKSIQPNRVTS